MLGLYCLGLLFSTFVDKPRGILLLFHRSKPEESNLTEKKRRGENKWKQKETKEKEEKKKKKKEQWQISKRTDAFGSDPTLRDGDQVLFFPASRREQTSHWQDLAMPSGDDLTFSLWWCDRGILVVEWARCE